MIGISAVFRRFSRRFPNPVSSSAVRRMNRGAFEPF